MEIAIKLRNRLLEFCDNDIDYAKGIMVNTQTEECRQQILDVLEDEPSITKNRLMLFSVALGQWEKEHKLR